ncbi:hypothetical protein [Leisingera sp.]|uniref:hypothetical protein n=1 Tax=Leisingera sp. TaxID=1879318 RepID=UPI002B2655D3|nr:hypothetical protein [Leisingera sp.]
MVKQVEMDLKNLDIKVSGLELVEPPDLSFKVVVELGKKMEKHPVKDKRTQLVITSKALDGTVFDAA